MAFPGAQIFSLDQSGVSEVQYTDTEHYCITRAFLQNPERMLSDIFKAVDEGEDA